MSNDYVEALERAQDRALEHPPAASSVMTPVERTRTELWLIAKLKQEQATTSQWAAMRKRIREKVWNEHAQILAKLTQERERLIQQVELVLGITRKRIADIEQHIASLDVEDMYKQGVTAHVKKFHQAESEIKADRLARIRINAERRLLREKTALGLLLKDQRSVLQRDYDSRGRGLQQQLAEINKQLAKLDREAMLVKAMRDAVEKVKQRETVLKERLSPYPHDAIPPNNVITGEIALMSMEVLRRAQAASATKSAEASEEQ